MQVSGALKSEMLNEGASFIGESGNGERGGVPFDEGSSCTALVVGDAAVVWRKQFYHRLPVAGRYCPAIDEQYRRFGGC